jgi:hypothetical protein
MVTVSKQAMIVLCVCCLLLGWRASREITPDPHKSRPFLAAIAKIAKTALWIAVFAEKAPDDHSAEIQSVMIDEQGYAHVNHARGW